MRDLFDGLASIDTSHEAMADGAVILRRKALALEPELVAALQAITIISPFRHMTTPGGFVMSVAMTNCGTAGWVTDRSGYRYDRIDPQTGQPWPALPDCFRKLAVAAASDAGYPDFVPDACLINRYEPGARLSLHQDKNERDFAQPIVSVSLGLPATFQFGGMTRNAPVQKFGLRHGDVVVRHGAEGRRARQARPHADQPDVSTGVVTNRPIQVISPRSCHMVTHMIPSVRGDI
jgi:alkylated DNA repair protein (DNA oxidative demethylase)